MTKNTKIRLTTQSYTNRDADSLNRILELFIGDECIVNGHYFTILSSNTSHLSDELEEALENEGFDPYEIRDLIEAGKTNGKTAIVEREVEEMRLTDKQLTSVKSVIDILSNDSDPIELLTNKTSDKFLFYVKFKNKNSIGFTDVSSFLSYMSGYLMAKGL